MRQVLPGTLIAPDGSSPPSVSCLVPRRLFRDESDSYRALAFVCDQSEKNEAHKKETVPFPKDFIND